MRPISVHACTWSLLIALSLLTAGCPTPSTPQEVERFRQAGPLQPAVDQTKLFDARVPAGPYCPVTGDVLELVMPSILQDISARSLRSLGSPDLARPQSHLCRVRESGMITLPIIGDLDVEGRDLPEIELRATEAYYPKYTKERPSIVAKVAQYRTARVSILGAVTSPGVYELQSNEMSLVALLMKAGGVNMVGAASGMQVGGSSIVRIRRPDENGRPVQAAAAGSASPPAETQPAGPEKLAATPPAEPDRAYTMVLPIKGMNIPFADVPLAEGDIVEVEGLKPEVFTVIGLVNRAGAFPYPPGARYNLLQAISFASGLNDIADPQYAKIYRQDADGTIIEGIFQLKGATAASAAAIPIKPGDVVAVEHTLGTRFNLFMSEVFRINAGINLNASYTIWNPFDYSNNNTNLMSDIGRSAVPSIISTVIGGGG